MGNINDAIAQFPADRIYRFGCTDVCPEYLDALTSLIKRRKREIFAQIIEERDPQGAFILQFDVRFPQPSNYPMLGARLPDLRKCIVSAYYVDLEAI